MYPLELWLLKRFCDRYGLDYQEIDNTLTYYENKEHLQKLRLEAHLPPKGAFGPLGLDLSGVSTWELAEDKWEAQMEWYLEHHLLEEYIAYRDAGWTVSEEVGEPYYPRYPRFSLATHIQQSS